MTDYSFSPTLTWDLGGSIKIARNQRVNVLDPDTGLVAPGLKVSGQPVSWVTSDGDGLAAFTSTLPKVRLVVQIGNRSVPFDVVSADGYSQAITASADAELAVSLAADAATAAANSANSAAASANLVGAPAKSAMDAAMGGDVAGLVPAVAGAARKANLPANAKEYGAKGDGTTDDTVALQAWLDAPGTEKQLTDGVYRITGGLTISRAKTRLVATGATILADGDIVALTLTSAATDSRVTCRIDGNLKARGGVAVAAGGCVVENCLIERVGNPTTSTWSCVGVSVTTHLGVTVRGNIIRNTHGGPGDGTVGNGIGMARAIAITSSAKNVPAVLPSMVENNLIDTVEGEEGDAITILFEPTTLGTTDYFQAGLVTVRNNVIRNPTKRFIKIQATDCTIHQNRCLFDAGSVPPNWNAHIQAYRASRCRITGNETSPVSPGFAHINVSQGVDTPMSGVVVENNVVRFGPGATEVGIYVSDVVNASIKNNVVDGSTILANRANNSVIQGNTIIGGSDTMSAVNLVGDNTAIRDNVDQSTTRSVSRWLVASGAGSIVLGNSPGAEARLGSDYTDRTITGTTTETAFLQFDNIVQPKRYSVAGRHLRVVFWGSVNTAVTTTTGFRLVLRIGSVLTGELRIPQTAVAGEDFRGEFDLVCDANGNTQRVMGTLSGLVNWAGSYSTRAIDLATNPLNLRLMGQAGATSESVTIHLIEVYG